MDGRCSWVAVILFIIIYSYENAEEITEFRTCGDNQCKEPIAEGRTLIRYFSQDKNILSFKQNEIVIIYSKGGGLREDYWEGQINGKRGYVPKRFIRETKILKKELIVVPVAEEMEENVTTDVDHKEDKEKAVLISEEVTNISEAIQNTDITSNQKNNFNPSEALAQQQLLSSYQIEVSLSDLPTATRTESDAKKIWIPAEKNSILSWQSVTAISSSISLHADKFSSTLFKGFLVSAENVPQSDETREAVENTSISLDSDTESKRDSVKQNPTEHDQNVSHETVVPTLVSSSFDSSITTSSEPQQDTPYISESPKDIKTSATSFPKSTVVVSKHSTTDYQTSITGQTSIPEGQTVLMGNNTEFSDETATVSPSIVESAITDVQENVKDTEVEYNTNHISEDVKSQSVAEDSERTNDWNYNMDSYRSEAEETKSEGNESKDDDLEDITNADEIEEEEEEDETGEEDEEEDEETEDFESDKKLLRTGSSHKDEKSGISPDKQENVSEPFEEASRKESNISSNQTEEELNVEVNDSEINSTDQVEKLETKQVSEEKTSDVQKINAITDEPEAEPNQEMLNQFSKPSDYSKQDDDFRFDDESSPHVRNEPSEKSVVEEEISGSNSSKSEEIVNDKTVDPSAHLQTTIVSSEMSSILDDSIQDQSSLLDNAADESMNTNTVDYIISSTHTHSEFLATKILDDAKHITVEVKEDDEITLDSNNESMDSDSKSAQSENIFESLVSFTYDLKTTSKIYIDSLRSYMQIIIDLLPPFMKQYILELEEQGLSPKVLVFTSIAGYFMYLFLVSYYLIKRYSKESSLKERLCKLDKQLFEAVTERDVLKDEVNSSKLTIDSIDQNLTVGHETISALETELSNTKNESHKLQEMVVLLKGQLDQQTNTVKKLQACNETTTKQFTDLEEAHEEAQNVISSLKNQINQLQNSVQTNEDRNSELLSQLNILDSQIACLQDSNSQLLQEAEIWNQRVEELQQQLQIFQKNNEELEESLSLKDGEIKVLQECMLQLKIIQDGTSDDNSESSMEKLEKLMEVSRITLDLKQISEEKTNVMVKLAAEEEQRKSLQDQMLTLNSQVETLSLSNTTLQQERDEAQTRLQILSNYFKEKEIELQRELGVQEAKRQETQETASSISQRAASYEEEISLYKTQIESLKKEIENQARSFKNQISLLDSKVHDNWLAARAAERRTEEAKQEAAVLRNKLTLSEQEKEVRNRDDDVIKSTSKGYPGSNGEIPSPAQLDSESIDMSAPGPPPLLRDSLDHTRPINFLPQDRPLPPPPFGLPLPFLPDRRQPPPPLPSMFDLRGPPPVHPFSFDGYRRPSPFQMMPRGMDFRMPPPLPRDHHTPLHNRVSPPFDQNSPPPRDYHSPPPPDRRNFPDRFSSPPPFDRRPPSGRRLSPTHSPYDRPHPVPHDRESHVTPPPRFQNMPPNSRTYERFPPSSQLGIRPFQPLRREVASSDSQKGDSADHPRSSSSFSTDQQDETITAV